MYHEMSCRESAWRAGQLRVRGRGVQAGTRARTTARGREVPYTARDSDGLGQHGKGEGKLVLHGQTAFSPWSALSIANFFISASLEFIFKNGRLILQGASIATIVVWSREFDLNSVHNPFL